MTLFVQRDPNKGANPAPADVEGSAAAPDAAGEEFSLFRDKPAAAVEDAPAPGRKRLAFFGKRVKGVDQPQASAAEEAIEVEARPVSDDAPVAEEMPAAEEAPKKARFGFGRKNKPSGQGTEAPAKAVKARRKLRVPKFQSNPIQVVIGYLPEVQARDAREYAMGIAEKHFQQLGITFFEVFEYDGGWVFELHEGGDGKAYIPAILEHFREQGPYQPDENVSAVFQTAQRKVEVVRMRQGLSSLLLPESSEAPVSEWLAPTKAMTPIINRQQKFFAFGLGFFAVSVLAMITTALFFRIQGYLPPVPPKVETITADTLPRAQWKRIEALPVDASVKALRYASGKWLDIELNQEEVEGAPADGANAPALEPLPAGEAPAMETEPVGDNLSAKAKKR